MYYWPQYLEQLDTESKVWSTGTQLCMVTHIKPENNSHHQVCALNHWKQKGMDLVWEEWMGYGQGLLKTRRSWTWSGKCCFLECMPFTVFSFSLAASPRMIYLYASGFINICKGFFSQLSGSSRTVKSVVVLPYYSCHTQGCGAVKINRSTHLVSTGYYWQPSFCNRSRGLGYGSESPSQEPGLGLGSCLYSWPSPLMSGEGLTVSWEAIEGWGHSHLG